MIRHIESSNGVQISIGKNAKGNDFLCRNSEKDEYWLHLQSESSPHAIVHTHIEDEDCLYYAANVLKQYSKLKHKNNVKVIYTQLENIKVTKTLGCVNVLCKPKVLIV